MVGRVWQLLRVGSREIYLPEDPVFLRTVECCSNSSIKRLALGLLVNIDRSPRSRISADTGTLLQLSGGARAQQARAIERRRTSRRSIVQNNIEQRAVNL